MPANETEWDARHRELATDSPPAPAGIVTEWMPMVRPGTALDLACGTGRHALFLASRGYTVVAVDWSGVALGILERRAREGGFSLTRGAADGQRKPISRGIQLIHANLETMRLPEAGFDMILCFHYLQRNLFAPISGALRPGGLLLFETYTRAQQNYPDGPRDPAYLLETGELRAAFPGLHVLFYRELNAGRGIASLVAQKQHCRA